MSHDVANNYDESYDFSPNVCHSVKFGEIDETLTSISCNDKQFNIMCQNIRSFNHNFDGFSAAIQQLKLLL